MVIAEAHIEVRRAGRYLAQLCKHAAAMATSHGHGSPAHAGGDALVGGHLQVGSEWTETRGLIRFEPYGRCSIEATEDALILRAEAVDEAKLRRIQDTLGGDLERMGRRDGLTVTWRPAVSPAPEPQAGTAD